ncbi:MAG: hypothetical protein LBH62_03625 [Nitrososphaerota archaeon]|jgi:hypothetical protein|uniref:hypothetical protein n=1 Tax=Candidatus Bathycorpusculum sp. TaxID=2994959 RepID=UPI002823CE66|nr:hypothetical protein [Candidatus Termiticorpusculum sp.]MCL2256896.1 hypothetical protein [Candidatus Termiticorpusculum sp.]MCL2293000.1 hypothetical protein [Candidatus Termiticorpusculum sp.]MDR0460515.1 hypothetical protein [Nitrososphaerota archaeon]
MMDQYRKGWAFRYLREAKAELEAAQKMPYMAPGLLLEAIRKARNAIYYSIGEPAFIENLLRDEIIKQPQTNDTVLKFLIDLESTVEALSHIEEVNSDAMMKQADTLVNVATEFVETLTQEKYQ